MNKNYIFTEEDRILITGGAGFIGYHLSQRLLELGATIFVIDNMNSYYDPALKEMRINKLKHFTNFSFEKIDISDKVALTSCFQKVKPTIVINLAAQAGVRYSIENPDVYINSNIIGFFNVLECCRNFPVEHLLYASSSSVYGANKKIPFSIEDKVDTPVSLYAATKKSNELMAYTYSHLYGIPATGLRFFTVYGPLGRPDMAYFGFAEKIMSNQSINVFNNGDLQRDFTYIDDIIECMVRMIRKPPKPDEITGAKYKVYNIGNNNPERLMDFIHILESVLGKEAKKIYLPMQPGDVYQTFADVTEIEKDFEFKPDTSLEDGLKKFATWYLGEWRSEQIC